MSQWLFGFQGQTVVNLNGNTPFMGFVFSAGVQTYENTTVVTCGDESEKQGDNRAVVGERVSRKVSVVTRTLSYMCKALALIPQSRRN